MITTLKELGDIVKNPAITEPELRRQKTKNVPAVFSSLSNDSTPPPDQLEINSVTAPNDVESGMTRPFPVRC